MLQERAVLGRPSPRPHAAAGPPLEATGVPLKAVQEILGHKSFLTPLRYAHLAPELRKEAVGWISEIGRGHILVTRSSEATTQGRRRMVPVQAPGVKHLKEGSPRPALRLTTPCHWKFSGRRKECVLATKPDVLKDVDRIDQKAWRQYQNHLDRSSPLERAEFYARQMEAKGLKSPWVLEKLLGEPFARVWRALKLLDLPEPIQLFLKEHSDPRYVRYFTERKLLGLLKVGDSRTAWRRFREMVGEAEREAGLWKPPCTEEGSAP